MFDVGFSELIVIAIVALVVIGPERLPKVARTAGHLLGRMQRYVNDVKADISREMQLDELKKLQAEMQESARSFERSISSEVQVVEQLVDQTAQSVQSVQSVIDEPVSTVVAEATPVAGDVVAPPTANAVEDAPAPASDSASAPLTVAVKA